LQNNDKIVGKSILQHATANTNRSIINEMF